LVGGSVAVDNEIVLSLGRMDRIMSLDEHAGHVVCQAGCVLETLQQTVAERGYTMPLDLGAKGSCQIGGNLATNAGGLRFLRYGSLHGSTLGLESVLADGTVLDSLTSLRKDNTGYDLKHLFIGSEGTLGVITACAIALPRLPTSVQTAFLGVETYEAVVETFVEARAHLGEVISAFEFLDAEAYALVTSSGAAAAADGGQGHVRKPLDAACRHYVLLELSGSNAAHDQEKLHSFLKSVMGSGLVVDGTIAQDETQAAAIWKLRESITPALSASGAVYKYDVSVPLAELYSLVEEMRGALKPLGAETVAFGHLGDGNLHLNFHTPGQFESDVAVLSAIEPRVYEWVASRRGSVSAEHGIGVMKPSVLHMSKQEPLISIMHGIKQLLDPKGILNPYKVLPSQSPAHSGSAMGSAEDATTLREAGGSHTQGAASRGV
jgi:D-2-hydroxyglutarate dehydrogenase